MTKYTVHSYKVTDGILAERFDIDESMPEYGIPCSPGEDDASLVLKYISVSRMMNGGDPKGVGVVEVPKKRLKSLMGDEWSNDCHRYYITQDGKADESRIYSVVYPLQPEDYVEDDQIRNYPDGESAEAKAVIMATRAAVIGAYTGREPSDVADQERRDGQSWLESHPDVVLDILRANVREMPEGMEEFSARGAVATFLIPCNDTPKDYKGSSEKDYLLPLYGFDMFSAWIRLPKDRRDEFRKFFKSGCSEICRNIAKAMILLAFPNSYTGKPSIDDWRRRISNGIKIDDSSWDLFAMLYEMASREKKDEAAQMLGVAPDALSMYLFDNPPPAAVLFPPLRLEPKAEDDQNEDGTAVAMKCKSLTPSHLPKEFLDILPIFNTSEGIHDSVMTPRDGEWHTIANKSYKLEIMMTRDKSGILPTPRKRVGEKGNGGMVQPMLFSPMVKNADPYNLLDCAIGAGRKYDIHVWDLETLTRYYIYKHPLATAVPKTYGKEQRKTRTPKKTRYAPVTFEQMETVDIVMQERMLSFVSSKYWQQKGKEWKNVYNRNGQRYLPIERVVIRDRVFYLVPPIPKEENAVDLGIPFAYELGEAVGGLLYNKRQGLHLKPLLSRDALDSEGYATEEDIKIQFETVRQIMRAEFSKCAKHSFGLGEMLKRVGLKDEFDGKCPKGKARTVARARNVVENVLATAATKGYINPETGEEEGLVTNYDILPKEKRGKGRPGKKDVPVTVNMETSRTVRKRDLKEFTVTRKKRSPHS